MRECETRNVLAILAIMLWMKPVQIHAGIIGLGIKIRMKGMAIVNLILIFGSYEKESITDLVEELSLSQRISESSTQLFRVSLNLLCP